MENTPPITQTSRSASRSPSWVVERDAIRLFGDRKARATLAIYHARRSAKKPEFYVSPDIARINGLSPGDLNWALDRLEGQLVERTHSQKGKYRMMRLLPKFEETTASPPATRQSTRSTSLVQDPEEERVEINYEEVMARAAAVRRLPNPIASTPPGRQSARPEPDRIFAPERTPAVPPPH